MDVSVGVLDLLASWVEFFEFLVKLYALNSWLRVQDFGSLHSSGDQLAAEVLLSGGRVHFNFDRIRFRRAVFGLVALVVEDRVRLDVYHGRGWGETVFGLDC